jgi:hypothetical protein
MSDAGNRAPSATPAESLAHAPPGLESASFPRWAASSRAVSAVSVGGCACARARWDTLAVPEAVSIYAGPRRGASQGVDECGEVSLRVANIGDSQDHTEHEPLTTITPGQPEAASVGGISGVRLSGEGASVSADAAGWACSPTLVRLVLGRTASVMTKAWAVVRVGSPGVGARWPGAASSTLYTTWQTGGTVPTWPTRAIAHDHLRRNADPC